MPKKRAGEAASPRTAKVPRHTVSFAAIVDADVPPHTLVVGTHPSIESFRKGQYFGHVCNAFWWIAGDALGFRRDAGLKADGAPAGRVDYFAALRHESPLLDYPAGLARFTSRGFALWDVANACLRTGSLDADIEPDSIVPNELRQFCAEHPTVRRICLASGAESVRILKRHHAAWLLSGALQLPAGEEVPAPLSAKTWRAALGVDGGADCERRLTLAVMPSVSPANAGTSYVAKREAWERLCYGPGLADYEAWRQTAASAPPLVDAEAGGAAVVAGAPQQSLKVSPYFQ